VELVGIGGLSGKKGGTAPGHDWTSPSQKGRPCRQNISAGVFRQSAAYGPNSIGPYFLSVGSIIALLPFLAPVFSALAVLGEIEFDGGRGEPLFESADLGLADTAEFL